MYKNVFISLILLASQTAHSEEAINKSQNVESSAGGDTRILVSMPDQSRELMRKDMLDHLLSLNQIIGYLASNNLDAAADIAETKMGLSSIGKHRGTGIGPGRFMPVEMRNIGQSMHTAATEFSKIAKQGDLKNAYSALQKVTSSCVACHYSYRTR